MWYTEILSDFQIRELIIAVNAFTNSQVDVLGFSMGSPIARKVCCKIC